MPDPLPPTAGAAGAQAPARPTDPVDSSGPTRDADSPYVRLGRRAWATVGIVVVLVVAGIVVGELSLVVIPVVLALFPAALLGPVAAWLRDRGLPPALAALLTLLGLLALLVGIAAGIGAVVANQLPDLRESLGEGLTDLETTIEDDPLGLGYDFEGFGELAERARAALSDTGGGEGGSDVAGGALGAASTAGEVLTGLVLLLVVLFFYLKDGGRLAQGVIATMPPRWRPHASALADRFWTTTGAYFRGQLTVALVDAVFIGLGLVLLGIPLAVPLAVLVFFGALFPIVGAFISGGVAVVVALADAGPLRALLVLLLIIVVQQVEGNVLEPLIMSNAIALHPLVVLLALTAGSVLLGILGAFLAVPVAASLARGIDYARAQLLPDDPEVPDAAHA